MIKSVPKTFMPIRTPDLHRVYYNYQYFILAKADDRRILSRIQVKLPIETSDIRNNESVATYIFGSDRSLKFELPRLIAFCLLNFLFKLMDYKATK